MISNAEMAKGLDLTLLGLVHGFRCGIVGTHTMEMTASILYGHDMAWALEEANLREWARQTDQGRYSEQNHDELSLARARRAARPR